MINKMREMAPIIMLVILVAFVGGTIFLDWGMNLSSRGNRMMAAGKINGREIPLSYFDGEVNKMRQQLQQQQGKDVDNEMTQQQYRMVPQNVWEQEVNKYLIHRVVQHLNLDVTADQVFSYIKNNPLPGIDTVSVFQTEGKYDTSKYIKFLNDPNNYQQYPWLREVESQVAKNILPMQNMETLLSAAAMTTPAEVRFAYEKQNSKVVYEYIKYEPKKVAIDNSAITDANITKYYETHRDTFKVKEQADLYFVKFPKRCSAFDENVYRQELTELKDRILKSEKPLAEAFAEEATIESDDPGSAQRGGDLNWFKKGMMVPEFDSVAFTLPVGTISDPIKTSFGLHIIYVEAREMRDSVMQVHARHILRKIIPTMETLDLIAERADSLRNNMLDKGFVAAAKADTSVKLDSTGLYQKGGIIPGIGYLSGAGAFVFKKSDLTISERLENNDAFYLITIKRKTPAGYMALEDAKEKIRKVLTDSLKLATAKKYLETIREKLGTAGSLAMYSKTDSTVISGTTDTVTGSQYVNEIGYAAPATAAALALPVGTISNVIQEDGNSFIVKPLWKKEVASIPSMNSPEMQQIAATLKQQYTGQRIYLSWYMCLKNASNIKSNIEDIYIE